MAKKILLISASPRKGGNTDRLCDEFARGAREAGHEVEKIRLAEHTIHYCTGCGTCSELGKPCPQRDDAAEIIDKMVAADTLVLATPVYFYTMSAQMKTLIDRTCPRYTELAGKEFYFIAAMAETQRPLMERTFDSLRGFLDCLDDPHEKGLIAATGVWKRGEIEGTPFLQEAYEMGRGIR